MKKKALMGMISGVTLTVGAAAAAQAFAGAPEKTPAKTSKPAGEQPKVKEAAKAGKPAAMSESSASQVKTKEAAKAGQPAAMKADKPGASAKTKTTNK